MLNEISWITPEHDEVRDMDRPDHIAVVLQGSAAIAAWREQHRKEQLDLRRADLVRANLVRADLSEANLEWADLRWADLAAADLHGANLARSDLHKADLRDANLRDTNLIAANLEDANLEGVDLTGATFSNTRILNTDLTGARGLTRTKHTGPSLLDDETLLKSRGLPRGFLAGCGHAMAQLKQRVFISYANEDASWAKRLAKVLDDLRIPYFLDAKDIDWGAEIPESVRKGIASSGAVIVVLSPASLNSQWVAFEIGQATALKRRVLPFLTHPSLQVPSFMRNLKFKSDLREIRKYLESAFPSRSRRVSRGTS
jgi:hypothetical protein